MHLCLIVIVLLLSSVLKETQPHAHHYQGRGMSLKSMRLKSAELELPLDHDQYERCGHQICNFVDVYPVEGIVYAITNKDIIKNLFGTVLNSTAADPLIVSRNNFFEQESAQLCNVEGPHTYTPKVMRNANLKWKYIVNVENYMQTFTAELCRTPTISRRRQANEGSFCTSFGFKCKQDYQDIFLLTYEYGKIEFDKFSIPTTCSCSCS